MSDPRIYRFGPFRFEPAESRLWRGGDALEVEPKALDVLAVLVDAPGKLQSRDALLDEVWGHRHVTPSTLNRVIALLRAALGDAANRPRFIETVPRRGYRFVADVQVEAGEAAPLPPEGDGGVLFLPPPLPARVELAVPRHATLSGIEDLLAVHRLVTLVGPGGVGKTELALEVARRNMSECRDGAWFIDVGGCLDGDDLGDALLAAFGIITAPGRDPLASIVAALRQADLLLVLDGCERIASACARLAGVLLANCPGLRLLATSQVRLGMEGEQLFRVAALSLPDEEWRQAADPVAAAREGEAVQLLEMRAREYDPGFTLERRNVGAVVALCRLVEGMPLALELAASRLRVLEPQQLLERLSTDHGALAAEWRGGPTRQRTLRDTLDWSFRLLSPAEARLATRLAVCASGWTLEAAEIVAGDVGDGMFDVAGTLGALIDKSIVVVDTEARPRRFRMLETIRLYMLERLGNAPSDVLSSRGGLLEYCLALAARAGPVLYESQQHWYGDLLEREQRNLRVVFEHALEHAPPKALALALDLRWYWWSSGNFRQAREWLSRALSSHARPEEHARIRALQFMGMMDIHLMERDRAVAALREALAPGGVDPLSWESGYAHAALAASDIEDGGTPEVRRLFSKAARAGVVSRDAQLLAYARTWISVMHVHAGRASLADICCRHAVAELEALARAGRGAPGFVMALARINLGLCAWRAGDPALATRQFSRAFELGASLRNARICAAGLEGLAYVACSQDRHPLSARLLGCAHALREQTGIPMSPHWQAAHDTVSTVLETSLGDGFRPQLESGRRARADVLFAESRQLATAAARDGRGVLS